MTEIDLMIMGILFMLAVIFMLLTVSRREQPLHASITMMLWFIIAAYYPLFNPMVSGIAWLFYGLGCIFLLITVYDSVQLMRIRSRRRRGYEEE